MLRRKKNKFLTYFHSHWNCINLWTCALVCIAALLLLTLFESFKHLGAISSLDNRGCIKWSLCFFQKSVILWVNIFQSTFIFMISFDSLTAQWEREKQCHFINEGLSHRGAGWFVESHPESTSEPVSGGSFFFFSRGPRLMPLCYLPGCLRYVVSMPPSW